MDKALVNGRTPEPEVITEATQKSENQFTKQIDQQSELLRTEVRGLVAQINELKDRFNRGEGIGTGVDKNKTDVRLLIGVIIGIIGFVIGLVGFFSDKVAR